MQNTTKFLCLLAICLVSKLSFGQGSENYSVALDVDVNASAPSITLNFEWAADALTYDVFRKSVGGSSWGVALANLTSGNSYTDNTIQKGMTYEYYVRKNGNGGLVGHGFVTTGVEVEAMHSRGAVLLIIDSALYESIEVDLNTLRWDLAGDGYEVLEYVVSSNTDHETIRAKIGELKALNPTINNLYILGHVAVPYSGIYCEDSYWVVPPDGHSEGKGNHCGAWPADVYYAIPTGTWTDTRTVVDGTRTFTRNEPNDNRYDQIILPGKVEYALGRVDLSDLPKFTKDEVELTQQYIAKIHNYRHGISKPVQRALIDENFGANANEAFGSSAYRSYGAVVGLENINTNDYMTTLKDSQYLLACGTGGGTFTSANGIGNTDNFEANQGAGYFNMIFGSFFGNWNVSNNFLRAPLAVENGGLTNSWAGRPNWHFYPLALNETVGFCTQLTQNNEDTYTPGYFTNQIHVALMGDPTLRLHMFEAPSDVVVSSSNANQTVTLNWTAASNDVPDGYNVYHSLDSMGPYVKANPNLISGTTYTHTAPHNGMVYYMVRAQRLETTHSGSFDNLSQGSFGSIDNLINTSINPILTKIESLQVYPNPSNGLAHIRFKTVNGSGTQLHIFDMKGNVLEEHILAGNGLQTHTVDLSSYAKGLYLIKVNNETQRLILQ